MARPGRRVLGASVRGPVHVREGKPNQDAIAWSDADGGHEPLVVALSDGHGGPKSPRSQIGARFAVESALEICRRLESPGLTGAARAVEDIVDRWTTIVHGHLAALPLSDGEMEVVGPDPLLAYGATLLVATVFERAALLLQLGDGDIMVAGRAGPAVRPLPPDPKLFANATTSLCMPDAASEFRCQTVPVQADEMAVVMLATDGLANAYGKEASLLQVGADLVSRVQSHGVERLQADLEGLLSEASAHSGDDVTVAVVVIDDIAISRRR